MKKGETWQFDTHGVSFSLWRKDMQIGYTCGEHSDFLTLEEEPTREGFIITLGVLVDQIILKVFGPLPNSETGSDAEIAQARVYAEKTERIRKDAMLLIQEKLK